jgi:hypothetical protein
VLTNEVLGMQKEKSQLIRTSMIDICINKTNSPLESSNAKVKKYSSLHKKFEQTPLTTSPASFVYTRRFTHRETCIKESYQIRLN